MFLSCHLRTNHGKSRNTSTPQLQIIAPTFWSAAQRDPSSKCFPSASAPLSLPSLVGHDRLSQVVIMDGLRMTGQRHPLKELIDEQNPCKFVNLHEYIYIYIHVYIYRYVSMYVCVCAC